MELKVFNVLGKEVSKIELNNDVFGIEPHNQAMFDLILSERAAKRQGTKKTKTRTEVSGGGRKPWKQKGTGRARQGSIRSPQWRGGGVVFGPTGNENYTLKVNKKVKLLAFKSGWSQKANDNEIILFDAIDFNHPKTSDFIQLLKNFNSEDKKVIILLKGDKTDYTTYLSSRNLGNVYAVPFKELSLEDIINSDVIFSTTEVMKLVEKGLE